MCIEGCVELWQLALGCLCGLQAGLALLNPVSPLVSSWEALINLPGIPGTQCGTEQALGPALLAQLGTLTSLRARAKGSTPLL